MKHCIFWGFLLTLCTAVLIIVPRHPEWFVSKVEYEVKELTQADIERVCERLEELTELYWQTEHKWCVEQEIRQLWGKVPNMPLHILKAIKKISADPERFKYHV